MSHIDDGRLNALLDGELSPAEQQEVQQHLAGCESCRVRLEEARHFLAEAAELLGAVVPPSERPVAPVVPVAPLAPLAPPRRTSQTAREAAIDIDGATHQSPAIRLFPQTEERREPARTRARPLPWTKIAWAASIVLTFSLGYLANDVTRSGQSAADQRRAALDTVATVAAAADQGAAARPASPTVPATRSPGSAAGTRIDRTAAERRLAQPPASQTKAAPRPAPVTTRPTDALAARDQPAAEPLAGPPAPSPAAGVASRSGAGVTGANRAAEIAPPSAAAAREEAPVTAPRAQRAAQNFRRTDLDSAVVRLSGSVRLIDGMDPQRVEVGPGSLVPGAQPQLEVVRVIYMDARGRRITLDQQRLPAAGAAGAADAFTAAAAPTMLYGDTLTATVGPLTYVRWLDSKNFWMSLSAAMPAESLRVLAERVR